VLRHPGFDLLVYCLNQRGTVALRLLPCFPGLQALFQDVFEVVVNLNCGEPLQVFPDPWVQDVATIGDAEVSDVNGTQNSGEVCAGKTNVTLLMCWLMPVDPLLKGAV
jgi:hypothetical protein